MYLKAESWLHFWISFSNASETFVAGGGFGLVDEIGGLNRAIAKAASLAKCKEYYAETWGETPSLLEQLLANSTDMDTYLDTKLKNTLGALYEPVMMMNEYEQMDKVQARMPYIINIK